MRLLHALERADVDVVIPDLSDAFDGYTIAILADIHHGLTTPLGVIHRAIDIALDAKPDLIALLGDYSMSFGNALVRATPFNRICYEWSLRALVPELGRLHARDGVVAILGNHDYWFDATKTAAWLSSFGFTVLDNAHRLVTRGHATLVIGGVADAIEGVVDASGGCRAAPSDAPTIVLSHHPDAILQLTDARRIDAIFAGHTHGGQIVFPMLGAPVTMSTVCTSDAASGWIPNARAPLYVSRGVGLQIPVRFRCASEVTVARLRRA